MKIVPHGFSTGILVAATVHFLASYKDVDLIEYTQGESPLFTKLVKNLIPVNQGFVPVPDAPGLGIELDEEVVDMYRAEF